MIARFSRILIALTAAGGTAAMATPSIVSLGSGGNFKLSQRGNFVCGQGFGGSTKWAVSGNQMTVSLLGGEGTAGISNNGDIVGGTMTNPGTNGFPNTSSIAARYIGGSWHPLPLIANATIGSPDTISVAYDMTRSGRFVCGLAYAARPIPFLFDAVANTSIELPANPDPMGGARANAVNGDGTVVVGFDSSPTMGIRRPSVWEYQSATSTWVETVLTETGGELFGVTADGTTLLGQTGEFNQFGYVGAIWQKVGGVWTATQIPGPTTLPTWVDPSMPFDSLAPSSISDSGVVVGVARYGDPFFGGASGAFMWTAAGGFVDLRDYLTAQGMPGVNDYDFVDAQAISGDGNVIAGTGGWFGMPWLVKLTGSPLGPLAPVVLLDPVPAVTISLCDFFILNTAAAGTPPFSYQWLKDGTPLTDGATPWGSQVWGATSNQLRITHQRPQDVGTYQCRITSPEGTVLTTTTVATLDNSNPPPTNDTCLTATNISEGNFTQNICSAWVDDGVASCQPDTIGDVWFRYTPTFTGQARIETCQSDYPTVISVYSACGGPELAGGCNDDVQFGNGSGGPCDFNTTSRIPRLNVTTGVPVLIRVAANTYVDPAGHLTLSIYQAPPAPVNDLCSNATPASPGLNPFDTNEASTDGSCSCVESSANDVWFSYTPPSNGLLSLTTCGYTTMSNVLSVHSGCPGTAANELACSDTPTTPDCWSHGEINNLSVTSGATVYIRLAGSYSSVIGSGEMSLSFTPVACLADIVGIGGLPPPDGLVTGDDFNAFITAFAAGDTLADIVGIGGLPPPDGLITGDDFNAFIAAFAAGCP